MNRILSFSILFGLWLLMSGKFDTFHLVLGVISALIVTLWTGDLFFENKSKPLFDRLLETLKFIQYSIWLFYQIILANFHVIYLALHPNMKNLINPQTKEFKVSLPNNLAKFILGNSITLTPGTVTIHINDDKVLVHAISDKVASETPGDMEKKITEIFV